MSEELAFGDGLGEGGAVDVDERAIGASRAGVQGADHELLPHTCWAGDQYGQVGWRQDVDFRPELPHRGTVSQKDPSTALERITSEVSGDLSLALGAFLEKLDQSDGAQRSSCERGKVVQQLMVEAIEGVRVESIGGQHSNQFAIDAQRTAEAGVDAMCWIGGRADHSVVGIGQLGFRGEQDGLGSGADRGKARMFSRSEATAEQVGRESQLGDWHQILTLCSEEGGCVAGQGAVNRVDEPLRPLLGREGGGQVARDRQQDVEGGAGHHSEPMLSTR